MIWIYYPRWFMKLIWEEQSCGRKTFGTVCVKDFSSYNDFWKGRHNGKSKVWIFFGNPLNGNLQLRNNQEIMWLRQIRKLFGFLRIRFIKIVKLWFNNLSDFVFIFRWSPKPFLNVTMATSTNFSSRYLLMFYSIWSLLRLCSVEVSEY